MGRLLEPHRAGKSSREAIGRSGGGLTSTIHLAARPTVPSDLADHQCLKAHRAVATRYDKRDYTFRGTIDLASIRIWLRDPVS